MLRQRQQRHLEEVSVELWVVYTGLSVANVFMTEEDEKTETEGVAAWARAAGSKASTSLTS